MSKDQESTFIIPIEIVNNWSNTLAFIEYTLTYWKLDNKWPTNLCIEAINEISNEMYEIIKIKK